MRIRGTLSALMAGALSLVIVVPVLGADILVYGPSDETESGVATGGGHTVTVATEATWAGMTTEQFAAFDAIVIGDAGCEDADGILDGAIANRTTWSAAVNGPITLSTFDPGAHDDGPGGNQDTELTLNSINFAASGPGTGLYFTVACYYGATVLTILDQFGVFTVDGESGNCVTIVDPAHAVMTGLTEEGLSDWGSSVHSHFLTFPPSFQVLANEGGQVIEGKGCSLLPLPVILAQPGATPTPTPTPTPSPTPTGTAASTATPAASLLPNTTVVASSPSETIAGLAALVLLLSGALYGAVELRRRGVIVKR
jgi:hypothetical protein